MVRKRPAKYRAANVFDIPSISGMWAEMVCEAMQPAMKIDAGEVACYALKLADFLRSNDHVMIVSTSGKNVTGYIHGRSYVSQYSLPKVRIFCESVYVMPKYRAKNIGMKLIELFIDESKLRLDNAKIKPNSLEFTCNYDEKTIKRWTKFGYKPIEVTMRRII